MAARQRIGIASVAVVALVVALVGWFALRSDGAIVHETELNDGGVWVTNDKMAMAARLNNPISQLDGPVTFDVSAGTALDVLQDGAAVLGYVKATGTLTPVEVQYPRLSSSNGTVPSGTAGNTNQKVYAPDNVSMHGGTLAVVDPKTGNVWAQRIDPKAGVTDLGGVAITNKPLAVAGGGAAMVVDLAGNVHVVSIAKRQVLTIPVTARGFGKPVTEPITVGDKALDISAVGDRWVVYDTEKDTIQYRGGEEPVKAGITAAAGQLAYAALQQPGPAADAVAIAGVEAVRMVTLGSGGSTSNGGVRLPQQNGVTGTAVGGLITRPAVLAGCVYAAWSVPGKVYANRNCGEEEPKAAATLANPGTLTPVQGLAFRINRSQITLNDRDSGALWDIDNKVSKIDQWDVLTPPTVSDNKNTKNQNVLDESTRNEPPKANADNMKARAGRTSVLHVLDNDTDPSGGILSIAQGAVSDPKVGDVAVAVSGDGQAINLTVGLKPAKQAFSFSYEVNNGKAKAKATVTVTLVNDSVNTPPHLRTGGAKLAATAYPVLPAQTVSVQAIGDWRDDENDPISLQATAAGTTVDGIGQLNILAPTTPGTITRPFAVADDHGLAGQGTVALNVLDPVKGAPVAPRTQPDAVRGVVGKPVQVNPLSNDIPGADPTDPQARLALVGAVASQGALTVDTDLTTGVLTITGSQPGTFELTYGAQQGTPVTPGRIRIDIAADTKDGSPPVAVPDSGELRDQSPALVDVLANDYSPRADVLVTQSVSAGADSDWLRPSIFQGRWVRLEATSPASLEPGAVRRGTVSYTISDGTGTATGTISVIQRGPLGNIPPVLLPDRATVRVGDVVSIPVLDNDTMAGGIPLRLDPASVKVVAGATKQNAFVSGNLVRYVPEEPDTLAQSKQVTIEYAAYPEGDKDLAQSARITVVVNPLPTQGNPNQAPVAPTFSTSVTAGEPLTITVPNSGVDPDGDSVTVQGVVGTDGGPAQMSLGRVVGLTPTTIRYEAYPNAAGTELIRYKVADRFGANSTGTIRVGVVPPSDPQPPVAVQDDVFAAPGKTVTVPFTQNDLISRGSAPSVEYQSLNSDKKKLAEWKVNANDLTVQTTAPAQGELRQFTYGLDDGVFDPSTTAVLVRGQDGFNNLPSAQDDVARPKVGEATAVVDVLANDTDIDSAPGALKVGAVMSPNATIVGKQVQVKILDHAYTVPYLAEDPDGGQAMALIYVPTGADGAPFVVDTALIEMEKDATKSVAINDYIKSPRNRKVSVTAVATVSTSPADDLGVEVTGTDTLSLTSRNGYVGPAAVMLEVTDRPLDQATSADENTDFGTAYVSVPVQVGPKVPVLRCPDNAIVVNAGGRQRTLDIPTLCNAWLPIGLSVDDVRFDVSWSKEASGVALGHQANSREATLKADGGAPAGTGILAVKAVGSPQTSQINVRVIPAPSNAATVSTDPLANAAPPTLRPISIEGLKEGTSQTIDIRAYLSSPLADGGCQIISATVESGKGLSASNSGCNLTVTAGSQPDLKGSVLLQVTDKPGSNRVAAGRATVTLLGRPAAPTGVQAVADRVAGGQAQVQWLPAAYNGGSPILRYTVKWAGGTQECTASPCTITGLTNGQEYRFTVTATNAQGESQPSAASNPVKPDTLPGQPQPPTMTSRGDRTLTFSWPAAPNKGSAIVNYRVAITDLKTLATTTKLVAGTALSYTATGLINNNKQQVKVQAINELGAGPWSLTTEMQSAGTPAPVDTVTASASTPTPGANSATIKVSWQATDPNGPPIQRYTVYRVVNGTSSAIGTVNGGTFTVNDTVPYDGRSYSWSVTAFNGVNTSQPAPGPKFSSVGMPATPSVSATTPAADYKATVTVKYGSSRSSGYTNLRWSSSSGGSGTIACGCASGGGTLTFKTSALSTQSTRITVVLVNSGGTASQPAVSNQVTPYGPTKKPVLQSKSEAQRSITWNWSLPTNGRPITNVRVTGAASGNGGSGLTSITASGLNPGQNYSITVTATSAGGTASATFSGTTKPLDPRIVNVRKGANAVPPNGVGTCARSPGCPKILFDIADFPPGSVWTVTAYNSEAPVTSRAKLTVNSAGNGYTWNGYIVYANGTGPVYVTLSGNGTYRSGSVSW